MKIPKNKPLLAYMTYPLTKGKNNGKKALTLALAIMAIYPNLHILVAHNTTQVAEQLEKYRSIRFDIAIIEHADLLILGKPLNYAESSGSVWEYEIARHFKKPCVTSDFLLGKAPKPNLWRYERAV